MTININRSFSHHIVGMYVFVDLCITCLFVLMAHTSLIFLNHFVYFKNLNTMDYHCKKYLSFLNLTLLRDRRSRLSIHTCPLVTTTPTYLHVETLGLLGRSTSSFVEHYYFYYFFPLVRRLYERAYTPACVYCCSPGVACKW